MRRNIPLDRQARRWQHASGTVGFSLSIVVLLTLALRWSASGTETVLIPSGATWRYLDNGSNQGTAWKSPVFDDSAWLNGPAQLGFGEGDEATIIKCGPDAPNCLSNNFITTYFRRSFNVVDPTNFIVVKLRLLRDDGAIVYLNGAEIRRDNMPAGVITYRTVSSTAAAGSTEATFFETELSPTVLAAGTNVIAVELHQSGPKSPDASFDVQLIAADTATVTRGPYLQIGTSTSIVFRWRSDVATDSTVRYGSSPSNLSATAVNSATTTEHVVHATGLTPDTQYYYSVGSSTKTHATGSNYLFFSAPPVGSTHPTRIWVIGDSGTAKPNAAAVRNAYQTFTGSRYTDLWLMLGDNAYDDGTDAEYQKAVFDMYPSLLRQTVVWPTLGNHDTPAVTPPDPPYFNIFTLPTSAAAGGEPSLSEKYYSFDFANIHIVCLDSMSSDRSSNGPMMNWLRTDLASNDQEWTIAFWHHPPYSKGHNSDSEQELVEMRQNAVPILESGGVDLVLSGHSHSYERSYLLDGHYGDSTNLTSSMILNGGSGREESGGAYHKPGPGPIPNKGAVYVVLGSSGALASGQLNHPAMFTSLKKLGSLVLDIADNRLDAKFLRENGTTNDHFTILKEIGTPPTPPPAPANLVAVAGNARVSLSWNASLGATSYSVRRSFVSGGPYSVVAGGVGPTSYTDTTVSNGTTYFYIVKAVNAAGKSPSSNEASATPLNTLP